MDLTTFFYALIGFTVLAGIRAYQKMGRTYLNPEAKSRPHRRGEDQLFNWLILITIIIVLVMAWYGPGANS
jgi:heme/copper-type cytochrome/quinol oxidase subunit 2